ncbi:transposase family protein [Streptomyces sp. NPDC002793]|uniref:transposase family protein n=1 Tax=Streptomyces sp. NPDC002793 TaxID=3154432 RepID=UPI00332048E3
MRLRSGSGKLPEKARTGLGVVNSAASWKRWRLVWRASCCRPSRTDVSDEAIRIAVCSTADGAACPDCGSESTRVHSSYLRFPADVPSGGRLVVLRLQGRRFFCPESSCARRTFAEQLPGLTRRHSRWTEQLRSTLAVVGLALACRAGARMARVFGGVHQPQRGVAADQCVARTRIPGPAGGGC